MSPCRSLLPAYALASVLAAFPTLVSAHAIVIASTPAVGAALPAGPVAFTLRYNSRIDARRSRLTLTYPDGSTAVLPIAPPPAPDVLTAGARLGAGVYSLRWQVLAVDGHITRGDIPFTLTVPQAAR